MENKRLIFTSILIFLALAILFETSFAHAASAGTYCAERTTDNASCQNVPFSQVNTQYNYAPTACASTTFCKAGTCVDRVQGNCFPNTANSVCTDKGGVWYDSPPSAVPLCQQGCCFIGDQAAFVTQTRCQQLASTYTMNTTFRSDITNEAACIASAQPQSKGACVYETTSGRTCKFTTKQDCQAMESSGLQNVDFHAGDLCSNPDLGTNCGPTTQTTCLSGQDQVYFVDSCGNPANVYDFSKIYSKNNPVSINYWSYIPGVNGVNVSANPSLAKENKTNGNCNYYLGSTCRKYDKSIDGAKNQPSAGDYICRSLDCSSGLSVSQFNITYGRYPYNGETWCGSENKSGIILGENQGLQGTLVSDLSKKADFPGSRDVRFVCYNGVVSVEPCADYRQEICSQGNVSGINYASCVPNRWRDCYSQTNKKDCLNTDQRDCKWIVGLSILKDSNGTAMVVDNSSGNPTLVAPANSTDMRSQASCVPKYTPGLSASEAQQTCSLGSTNCVVTFTSNVVGGNQKIEKVGGADILGIHIGGNAIKTCFYDNGSVRQNWIQNYTNLCMSLGDCGVSVNYMNDSGYNKPKDLYSVQKTNSSK